MSGPLRCFFGGSIYYLISAVCILAGVAQILAPVFEQIDAAPIHMVEKFYCLVALNVYELTLLGVALLILLWKNVTDDAVGLAMLIAAFMVGSAVALDTVAPDFPLPVTLFGLGGFILAHSKLLAATRYIIGRVHWTAHLSLGLLLLWNFGMPAVLSWAQHAEYSNPQLVNVWYVGWNASLVFGLVLVGGLLQAPTGSAGENDGGEPFLRRSYMRWIFIGIIFVGSYFHQWALLWSFNLKLQIGDLLPAAGLIAIVGIELLRVYGRDGLVKELAIGGVVAWLVAVVFKLDLYDTTAESTWGLVSYPPLFLLLMAFYFGIDALMRGRVAAEVLMTVFATGGVLVFGAQPGTSLPMNVMAAGTVMSMCLALMAIAHQSSILGLSAAAVYSMTTGFDVEVIRWAEVQRFESWGWAMLLFGALVQVVYCISPKRLPWHLAFGGAVCLAFGVWHCFGREVSLWYAPMVSSLLLLVAMLFVAARTRDWVLLVPSAGPSGVAMYGKLQERWEWMLILLSFVVLAFGAAMSILKAHWTRPPEVSPEVPPGVSPEVSAEET